MSMLAANDVRGSNRLVACDNLTPRQRGLVARSSVFYDTCKWSVDFGLSLFLFIATAPLVAVAMLAIKLTSHGPALYSQIRLGKHGLPFTIYKLRTMVHKCEILTGARWSLPGDQRITYLGKLLRKTHIDELPQLWNVLRGDMSLVGPRPERPEFVPQLEHAIAHYRGRLQMRPGITGLAQVQLPPDTDLASVRLKLAYDLHYVRNASLWLDGRILLSTALKLVRVPFASLRKVFRFPVRDTVEDEYHQLPADHKTLGRRAQPA
jgi:lipopolysaccharide/colanic/teichoic acid biosynthesis glycosyltransferase